LWPLHLHPREIPLADLNAIEAIRYRPIRDSGGWGIRLGRHGWYYTASGDRGVLIARDGERNIVIGSQSPEEFVEAIQRFRR
jgi:hypothetical protein